MHKVSHVLILLHLVFIMKISIWRFCTNFVIITIKRQLCLFCWRPTQLEVSCIAMEATVYTHCLPYVTAMTELFVRLVSLSPYLKVWTLKGTSGFTVLHCNNLFPLAQLWEWDGPDALQGSLPTCYSVIRG